MSNIFKYAFLFGMIMLGGLSLSSCSDDDDDNGGSGSKSVGVLDESSGLRITSAGDYNYVYQEDGRLLYILSGSSCRYEFSYSPNKIVHVDGGDYAEAENYTVSYNGSGYVSSANFYGKWEVDDGRGWVEETGDLSFSYDTNGHITKINGTYKETAEYEEGKIYSESGTTTYTLTWSNNLLQKVVCTDEGRDEDGPFKYVETYTLSYNNEAMANYANKYLQYACFADRIFEDFMEKLCYVGLLGNGPAFLPSSLEYEGKGEYYNEYGEKKSYEYSDSYTYRYGFNSDGAISYDYSGSSKTSYSYDNVESSSGGSSPFTRATDELVSSRKHKKHLDLFKLHTQK